MLIYDYIHDHDTKDNVIKLLNSWEGKKSTNELRQILGQNKSEELLRNNSEDGESLSEDELLRLRNMFRDSLTFD